MAAESSIFYVVSRSQKIIFSVDISLWFWLVLAMHTSIYLEQGGNIIKAIPKKILFTLFIAGHLRASAAFIWLPLTNKVEVKCPFK